MNSIEFMHGVEIFNSRVGPSVSENMLQYTLKLISHSTQLFRFTVSNRVPPNAVLLSWADAQLRASLNLWWHLGAQVKYHAALEMAIWHYVGIFGEQRCVPCQRHAA